MQNIEDTDTADALAIEAELPPDEIEDESEAPLAPNAFDAAARAFQQGIDGPVPVPAGRLFTVHAFAPKGVRDRAAEALFIPGARLGLEHAEAVTKCAELNDSAFDKPGEPHIWFGVVRFDEKDFDATAEGDVIGTKNR